MKIAFIGAGMAALVAGEKLARAGYEVSIYEKEGYDSLSYDWHDDVNRSAFEDFGLPLPDKYFVKRNWTFIPPSERVESTLSLPEEELDLSCERRLMAQQYVDRAADVVDFHFGKRVDSLVIEDGAVKGIVVDGERVEADLVVDNSGALSPFRASLEGTGITPMPREDEIFVAYRGFHLKTAAADPTATNRAYLKHIGQKGISWSILDPAGTVNVLIGRVGKLQDEEFKCAYEALKASNPNISDDVVRGGIKCVIPIRYPLTQMVWDGYVAIGDSAFMTIPMIGSGIENCIRAAEILADVIIEGGSVDKKALWQYQVKYFLSRGAEHMGVDVLKRWLLDCAPDDLDWLFEHGVVGPKEMAAGATGKLITLSFGDLLDKVRRGYKKLPLLLKLNSVLQKTKRAARLGRAIPKEYDSRRVAAWQTKVEKLFED